jgi:phage gpG-like protein
MSPEQGIAQLQRRFKSVLLRVPLLVGNEAVNFSLDAFRNQGWLGNTFQLWPRRKVSWGKIKRNGRNTLINTGRLRRSIRIISLSKEAVVIGSDVKYARAHNEGLQLGVIQSVKAFTRRNGVAVKQHTRRINMKIPRRQFMGNSPYLNQRIKRTVSVAFMRELNVR